MKAELLRLVRLVVEYVTRLRSIAGGMLLAGGALLGQLLIGWPDGDVVYQDSQRALGLTLHTSDLLPSWTTLPLFYLGVGLMVVGAALGINDYFRTARLESRRKSIVVEVRGLHSSPDTPASASSLGLPRGVVDRHLVDFRARSEHESVSPALALEKISAMKHAIASACGGRAPEDVTVAVGGLAAVPCLFLVGMLLDNESSVVVFDWDRNLKDWRLTDGPDDGKRMLPAQVPLLAAGSHEVVLAVSVSYSVDEAAISRRFGTDASVVHLRAEEVLADRFWSADKQQACVVAFTDAVQQLMQAGVQRIDLVLAAPASLAIRLGMAYDRRLMPDLVVHQYERSSSQGYPWGLRMPTHGQPGATVEWCPKSAVLSTVQEE